MDAAVVLGIAGLDILFDIDIDIAVVDIAVVDIVVIAVVDIAAVGIAILDIIDTFVVIVGLADVADVVDLAYVVNVVFVGGGRRRVGRRRAAGSDWSEALEEGKEEARARVDIGRDRGVERRSDRR